MPLQQLNCYEAFIFTPIGIKLLEELSV